jgi:hypothetical protein
MAEQASEQYQLSLSLFQAQGTDLRRNQMDEAETERKQAIRSAGAHLREYHDWLDKSSRMMSARCQNIYESPQRVAQ